mgnify:FL=1
MAAPSPIFQLRVTELWVTGDILGPPRDLESVTVVLGVDLPVEDVAWWTEPAGSQHWANAARLATNPVLPWWRSTRAPVFNHRIQRPALVWDAADGVHEETVTAIEAGRGVEVAIEPPTGAEFADRMRDELAVSLGALRACTDAYDERRWKPGKLGSVADALWRASDGYLDVLAATPS